MVPPPQTRATEDSVLGSDPDVISPGHLTSASSEPRMYVTKRN